MPGILIGSKGSGICGFPDPMKEKMFQQKELLIYHTLLVGGFSPTYLKHMRKSNWIISPNIGVKLKDVASCQLPPPRLHEPSWKEVPQGSSKHLAALDLC